MLKPMIISGLTVDPLTNSPIVILKEIDGDKTLPIWIGLLEATAIASELEGIEFSRPMTHDLLKNILEMIDVKAEPGDKSEEGKKWQEILESLNPEDFGKYKM